MNLPSDVVAYAKELAAAKGERVNIVFVDGVYGFYSDRFIAERGIESVIAVAEPFRCTR